MTTSFSGGESRSTRREPPTMGVNDIVGQLPVDQTGLSFSDAETQRPDDLQNVPVPVLRLRFPSDWESDSSDSSSH
jgi:hypothetical protein